MEPRVAVAYSGGRDSTALLHATLAVATMHGVRVFALHVHHGLSSHADEWQSHCEAQCARWARAGHPVEFHAHRLSGAPASGDSVEAWARDARYRALRTMAVAHEVSIVLLAHHRRDQAETWLLQALRGAGVAGLAAMPRSVVREGIAWHRPWLAKGSDEIDAYVRRHRLKHISDDSNADPRFARNRLRLQVWPALKAAFPHAETTLATAAQWAQQADAALAELAALDVAPLVVGAGIGVERWLALSPARRSNALRAWLAVPLCGRVPASLVIRLCDELPTRKHARWPVEGGELRVYRGVLCHVAQPSRRVEHVGRESVLSVQHAGTYPLPGWLGSLVVEPVAEMGVPLAWLAHLELRERAGAERFQAGTARPPRSLKKQFQEAGVPSWARSGPLLYSGGQLVFVPGLGLDARVVGVAGQRLARLRWVTDAGLA